MVDRVAAGMQQAIGHPLAGPPPPQVAVSPEALSVRQFMGRAPTPTQKQPIDQLPTTMTALAEVVRTERWLEVLTLTSRIVPHDQEEELRLKLARILALTKRKSYQDAANEFATLKPLDDPSYRYETYPQQYPGRCGSMMPFSLEMLFAILPHFLNNTRTAVDRIFHLLHVVTDNINALNQSEETLLVSTEDAPTPTSLPPGLAGRDLSGLVGPYMRKLSMTRRASTWSDVLKSENTAAAVEVDSQPGRAPHFIQTTDGQSKAALVENLATEEAGTAPAGAAGRGTLADWRNRELRLVFVLVNFHIIQKDFTSAVRLMEYLNAYTGSDPTLLYHLGLLFLQIGNLRAAEDIFDKVECLPTEQTAGNAAINFNMNRGLLNVCQGNFKAACEDFQAAWDENGKNVSAANNLAIAKLYIGQLHEAISVLEQLVRTHPDLALTDPVVFNLCTLYELSCHRSLEKKELLKNIAKDFAVREIDLASFKL